VFILNNVTYTATVAGVGTGATPTGTVTFYDGATALGTVTLTAGVATLTAAPTTAVTHSITAVYNGNTNYLTKTSNTVSLVAVDFTIAVSSGAPSTASVLPGTTASYDLVVTPVGAATFPAVINLAGAGAQTGVTVTLTPSSTAAGAGATNTLLNVPTINSLVASNNKKEDLGRKLAPFSLALLLLPLMGIRRGRKMWQRFLSVVLLLVGGLAASAALSGCSSVPSGYFGQSPSSYTIVVTGTSGPLTHSTSVTLTIE
jgi:hypothetical protein